MSLDTIDHDDIAHAAAQFLDDYWSIAQLHGLTEDRSALSPLWRHVTDLGWHDVAVPEVNGGLGLGLQAAAIIAEQTGIHLFPGPVLETIAAHHVLRPCGVLSEDDAPLTLALFESGSAGLPATSGTAIRGETLTGTKTLVPFADEVGLVVAIVGDTDGPAVVVGRTTTRGVISHEPLDFASRPCDLDLAHIEVVNILTGPPAENAARDLRTVMTVLSAWRLLGVAEQTLAMTVDYAQRREQFGVPIATMQAVRHRLADMQMLVNTARNLCRESTRAVSDGAPDTATRVHALKAYCSRAARLVAEDAMQVHGGIAFTYEFDLHLFVRHALSLQSAWGDQRHHEKALGADFLARAQGI